jgi:hypothetical protein
MTKRKAKTPMETKRASKPNEVAATPPQSPTWDLEQEDNYAEDVNNKLGQAIALLNLLAAGAPDGNYAPDQLQFALEGIEGLCSGAFGAFVELEELRGRSGPRKTQRYGKRRAEAQRLMDDDLPDELDRMPPNSKAH